MKEILIVGRGLAGATLSFEFTKRNIPHKIFDQPKLSTSSKVAAGLINPIVLKRLKMVQGAEEFTRLMPSYYEQLEELTGHRFFNPAIIEHIFATVGEQNLWEEKKDLLFHSQFLKSQKPNPYHEITAPLGLGIMSGAAWLDTEAYLKAHKLYCQLNNITLVENTLTQHDVESLASDGYPVILCNGHLLKDWDLLPSRTFTPTRGEVMTIKAQSLPKDVILHSSIFTIHLGDDLFKVGATYHWDNFSDQTTSVGLEKLKEDLEKIYTGSYKVEEHKAGVRPNIKDRKPILGSLGHNIFVFNGMGSRAALMTPYLAGTFCDFLTNSRPLPPQYDVTRFL